VLQKLSKFAGGFGPSRLLALGILAFFITLRIADPGILQTFRLQIFDVYQSLKPRERTPQPIAIVDLDEASLDAVGQWPWPRTIVADLVRKIRRNGAVAVAFDIVFAEPDRLSPAIVAGSLKRLTPAARKELESMPSNDDVLSAAFQRGVVIVGETAISAKIEQAAHKDPPKPAPVAVMGNDPIRFVPKFEGLLRNIPKLEEAAKGRGVFTVLPERDGVIRRVPAIVMADGVYRPTLGLEMLRVATGGQAMLIKADDAGISSVVVGGVEIPTDRNGRIWVRFTETNSRPDYISAKSILDGSVDPKRLQNKLLFIGTSATGLRDIKTTPLDPAMSGVEVHAQLIETILSKSHLTRPYYALGAELMLMVAMGLFLMFLLPYAGAIGSLMIGGVLAGAVAGGSWYFFTGHGLLIDVIYPLGTSFAMFVTMVFYNYYQEEKQRRRIRGAFQQYLSPDLVEQLAKNSESLVLGGESREMTFMFSDVRGFTTISESYKANPQGLTQLMNRFLTPLSNAIMEKKGTIDKYMGDAIMAFWNAPLGEPEHCRAACLAGLEMLDRLEQVNVERKAEAEAAGTEFLPLNVGIGINTGLCVVGNMGSDSRFDYSVLGDSVNLASRLEGQSKNYGVKMILGEATTIAVRDELAVIELDLIQVKGKLEPERIYALVGADDVAKQDAFKALRDANETMLEKYRAQDWAGARAAIETCRSYADQYGIAEFYNIYEQRIEGLEADPPGKDWNGVFVATSK